MTDWFWSMVGSGFQVCVPEVRSKGHGCFRRFSQAASQTRHHRFSSPLPLPSFPPLKHPAVFNIASKAADFKMNPTGWSVTKATWEDEPCASVLHA